MKKYLLNILLVIAICFCNSNTSYADGLNDDIKAYFTSKPHFMDQEGAKLVSTLISTFLKNGNKRVLFSCAQQLSNKGYSIGDYFLGYCYEGGEGCDVNPDLCFHYFKKAATAEVPFCWAYRSLGYCYLYGNGTAIDNNEVYKWFKKATETIKFEIYLASSYLCLGHCYNNGWYVLTDYEKAIVCYKKVLDVREHEKTNTSYGNIYDEHFDHYSRYAASNLAVIYNNEMKDYSKSYQCARLAANLGDQDWQLFIGKALLTGMFGIYPIEKDQNQAIIYLRKAKLQGNVEASIKLSELGL